MATIKIVKFKLRRGTDAQRRASILNQGEMGYTTDTKRVFVGSGVLSGGTVIGSKIHQPVINEASLLSINSEVGDLAYANNTYFQLTAADYTSPNSWMKTIQKIDPTNLTYSSSNVLSIKDGSITPNKLSAANIGLGLQINSNILNTKTDGVYLTYTGSGALTIATDSLNESLFAASMFTNGISGGESSKVGIQFDPDTLYLKNGTDLSVFAIPNNSITFTSLDSSWVGPGLIYDLPNTLIKSVVVGVDGTSLSLDGNGLVGMQTGSVSASNELPFISSDIYGRVISNTSSIYDAVSCLSSTDAGPLSSLFNGTPNQLLSGAMPNVPITVFTVLSANSGGTVALNLSSAGFLMFQNSGHARQDGKYYNRFAVPIFIY